MKATGIVRRIDELGRVVIPEGDPPRGQHIRSGDSLEIFMEENGEVVFKNTLRWRSWASRLLSTPMCWHGGSAVVCWSATGSISWRQPVRARMSCSTVSCRPELNRLLKKRRLNTAPANPDRRIRLGGRWLPCAAPILVHGDIEGGVLLPDSARDPLPEAEVIRAAATAAEFLARWMEE